MGDHCSSGRVYSDAVSSASEGGALRCLAAQSSVNSFLSFLGLVSYLERKKHIQINIPLDLKQFCCFFLFIENEEWTFFVINNHLKKLNTFTIILTIK